MKILFKKYSVFLLLFSFIFSLHGQAFAPTETIPTDISGIAYNFLPVQSEEGFNFLFYSTKKEKQSFELLTIKNATVSKRMQLKNPGLDGGGSWFQSAFMSNDKLLLYHVDGFLVVYDKNRKGDYVLKETINIRKQTGRNFNTVSMLDAENVILINSYNFYIEKKLYDNYALYILNLRTKNITYQKEIDLGKGILLSHFTSTVLIESKKDKIAVAHPTLPFIYLYNDQLNPVDTIYAQFQDTIPVDSVIRTIFSDIFLEFNRTNPKEVIDIIEKRKINQLERIEKVFWLNDDIVGYTIRQPFSMARIFVFYSISKKIEIYKEMESYVYSGIPMCTNFLSSTRVLIYNNKTVGYDYIYENDESDFYHEFTLYDILPFSSAE